MRSQRGFTLIEVLVAMAILGVVSVGFLGSMASSSRVAVANERIDTGRAIAQAQMEYVKTRSFLSSGLYTPDSVIMENYPGYSVEIEAVPATQRDAFIQTVTVTVYYGEKEITRLQDCKVKR